MSKIFETESFTVNGDASLTVTIVTEFTNSIEEPYIINQTITNAQSFIDRASYKASKENLVREGKIELERATNKIAEAEKILIELNRLAELEKLPGV